MMNKLFFALCVLILVGSGAFAQDKDMKFATIEIKTSAVCDMCIETIEKGFAFEKGVKSSNVDLEANTVTVTYHTKKTDEEAVKTALTKMGYAADDLAPDSKAFDNLHYCCKADHDHGTH